MAKKFMPIFGLFLIIFSLNVIQSKLYESKLGELSEASSNVQENLVSLNDLNNLNIKNNIKKRDVSGVDKQEYLVGRSMSSQSGQRRQLSPVPTGAKRPLQFRVQRKDARRGVSRRGKRIEIGGRRVQRRKRGRSSRGRISLRGRPFGRGGSRGRGRQNQSSAGEKALEEIDCDGEKLEVGPEIVVEGEC